MKKVFFTLFSTTCRALPAETWIAMLPLFVSLWTRVTLYSWLRSHLHKHSVASNKKYYLSDPYRSDLEEAKSLFFLFLFFLFFFFL